MVTRAVHLKDPGAPINYGIKKTGYYCVNTAAFSSSGLKYSVIVEFRNAYGELRASQIAKVPFYGGITIVYAVVGAYVKVKLSFSLVILTLDIVSGHFSMFNTVQTFVSTLDIYLSKLVLIFAVAVQNYITAIIIFLIVEMLMTWAFFGMFY